VGNEASANFAAKIRRKGIFLKKEKKNNSGSKTFQSLFSFEIIFA